MRSRRNNVLTNLAKAPWPVGLVIGVVLFLLIHYGIPAWMASRGGPLAQAFARGANPFGMRKTRVRVDFLDLRATSFANVHCTDSGTFTQCDQGVTTF